jgi:hypothetical protein
MRSFIASTLYKILLGWKVKFDEIGGNVAHMRRLEMYTSQEKRPLGRPERR